jgi:hypothetical protein
MPTLRIFVSSPKDVNSERTVARRVIERLAVEYAYHFQIEPVMSELEPMVATQTPQASITPPSETDIVVVLLWARLGTRLPRDGRFTIEGMDQPPTGTEWEFYDALRAHQSKGLPELLVYHKTQRPMTDLTDVDSALQEIQQKKDLEQFLVRWFRNADGSWKAWMNGFEREEELEHLLDTHLRKLIQDRIGPDPKTDDQATTRTIEGNPYRGLSSFNIEDAPLFFGRTRALNELRDVLETQNAMRRGFVIVTGGSGSGKSSLVKAGLLADLKNPYRVGRVGLCRHAVMRPTDQDGQLLLAVAQAIMSPTAFPELKAVGWTPEDLARVAADKPQQMIDAIRHAAGVAARGERLADASDVRLCIVVDQLEELFTAGIPKSAIHEFTRLVTLLARSDLVWVIATLRSDFYHRLDETPDLLLLAERGMYRLNAPQPTELGQMIHRPAQLAGLRFEKHPETGVSLDAILQDDATSDPTALPLLEFALTELWNQRTKAGLLTIESYERMGRMTGAIAERAETLIATLSTGTQAHLAPTLRALVTVARADVAPTAATVNRSRIATTPERTEILDKLISARLLLTDDIENRGDPKCRLAHEKLIETWPRLRKLAEADRTFLEVRSRLQSAAEAWQARGSKRDLLLRAGSQLGEGEDTLKRRADELDPMTIDFIKKSIAGERKDRSRRQMWTTVVAGVFAALFLGTLGLLGQTVLQETELKASEQRARAAAELANRGFGVAIDAADAMSKTVGTGGTNIDGVLDDADRMLEKVAKDNASGAAEDILERRAQLLLSFAETAERIGDYGKQLERIMFARGLLDPVCGGAGSTRTKCRHLFADTYRAEGDHLRNVGKPSEARKQYQVALELRPETLAEGAARGSGELAAVRAHTGIAMAFLAEHSYDHATAAAESCLQAAGGAKLSEAENDKLQLARAGCLLAAAIAARDHKEPHFTDTLSKAEDARTIYNGALRRDSHDINSIGGLGHVLEIIGATQLRQRDNVSAQTTLEAARQLLQIAVASNPQNDQLADRFQALLVHLETAYINTDRKDLALQAAQARVDLATQRRGTPRDGWWRTVQIEALGKLRGRFIALRRYSDALTAAQTTVAVHRQSLTDPTKAYPEALLYELWRVGGDAVTVNHGLVANDAYFELLDQVERQTAAKQTDQGSTALPFSSNDWKLYWAIKGLVEINPEMLPPDRRVAIHERIADRVSRAARSDPRNLVFRYAEGDAFNRLAVALDLAGDTARARDAHERASNAGSRASSVILRRWYLEGYKTIKPDEARARELEAQAKQARPPSWGIETKNRATAATETVALYFREPVAGSDVMADELYRIARYLNLEPTEAGAKLIAEIFRIASENKETVAALLERARNADSPAVLDNTSVTADLAKAASLVKERQLANAYEQVAMVRGSLMTRGAAVDANSLMAWAAVAESFTNVATLADELKDVPTSRKAAADAEEIMTSILAIEADGTSPRLNLAASLERVARRTYQNKRPETARLFRRANALRTTVRVQDPQNSECACQIASNFQAIANFEKGRGRLDEAVQAMLRSLQISEELDALEPHQNWSRDVAARSLALATLFHERNELRLALMYARPAVSIRAAVAARHSATSDERKAYAEALEAQSLYAREWAKHFSLDREAERKDADQFFELGISSLLEANEIRESVLRADPADASCRCQVGTNFVRAAGAFRDWRKLPEQIKALDDAILVQRAVHAKQPEYLGWQYNLGLTLKERGEALATSNNVDHASVVANEEEAVQYLRKIVLAKDLDKQVVLDTQNSIRSALIITSFHSLFLTATDKTRAAKAMQAADEAIALSSDPLVPLTNKAHALMYLGREAEAIEVYRTNVGKPIGKSTWEAAITDDFDQLTAQGLRHPTMDKVRPMLAPRVSKN